MIDGDFLIIDESSMIDASLFLKLLENTDEKQEFICRRPQSNPSIGAGSIFRDIIESNRVPITTLNEIFRQKEGSKIITIAYDIINGVTTDKG